MNYKKKKYESHSVLPQEQKQNQLQKGVLNFQLCRTEDSRASLYSEFIDLFLQ